MNEIAVWAHMPLVQALGRALVHFLWEGAIIALIAAAVLAACRRANTRYGVACVALFAMLLAFGVTCAVSVPNPDSPLTPPATMRATDSGTGSGLALGSQDTFTWLQVLIPWVVLFWMAGTSLVGVYRLGGWMAAQRLRRAGVCAAPPEWQFRLKALAHRIGVSKPLLLLESSLAEVPLVIGLLRPAILIPAGLLAGLPQSQLEFILLHELAHIRRFDYLANLIQTLVESLLFYHPAVWWISNQMRLEREHCCDEAVVAIQGDPHAYAETLVTLEERRCVGKEPALAATGGNLMNRIRRILHQPEPPRPAAALVLSMGLLLGIFCLIVAAQQSAPSHPELETPYHKWMVEDVAYIISAEEQVAFERLQTDAEREHFIEQFWLRRDPTPGTPANEFKQEHYRRIAYANQHFAGAGMVGWTTDRGRIYIAYGPPDEIEDHGHSTPPRQEWLYHMIAGVGTNVIFKFVDLDGTGAFRVTAGNR